MAIYSIWQTYIEDSNGQPLSGASIEVKRESDSGLQTLYSTRTGTSKSNPFTSSSTGYAFCYMYPGNYKITVTSGAFSATFRNVVVSSPGEYTVFTEYADLAEINAAIPSPQTGAMVYVTTQGAAIYKGGAWKLMENTATAVT